MDSLELAEILPKGFPMLRGDRLPCGHVTQIPKLAFFVAYLLALGFALILGELLTVSRGGPFPTAHGSSVEVVPTNSTARRNP
jgi:hypothetical protein